MKVAYLIPGTFNSGGMERVLCNKTNYLADVLGYDVSIITTDQQARAPFFRFSPNIEHYDLSVNYSELAGMGFFAKTRAYLKKQKLHRERLTEWLNREKYDIVISMFGPEVHWLPGIKDGSKKVAEIHFSKFFREQQARKGLWKLSDIVRSRQDEKVIGKYDRFVVLTEEDKGYWGDKSNISVIYNASVVKTDKTADGSARRAIAVGRLTYQKGYPRLVEAWQTVHRKYPDWELVVFGSGEDADALNDQIREKGLEKAIKMRPPTNKIEEEYLKSSIYVLSSHYEGLPMVLLEAMGCGVPAVAFTCKCGPRDVIDDGTDGILVPEGDVTGLAEGICRLIEDETLRRKMGKNAVWKVRDKFSEEKVMAQWDTLFKNLKN